MKKSEEWKELIFAEALNLSSDKGLIKRFIRTCTINYLVGKYFQARENELQESFNALLIKQSTKHS